MRLAQPPSRAIRPTMNRKQTLGATFICLSLTACATADGDYPSLAIRDIERAEGRFEPVSPQRLDVPKVITGITRDPAAIRQQATESHARFMTALATARGTVLAGRGAQPGSNAWGAAQVALADLESIRSSTAIALADLDTLKIAADVQYAASAVLDASRQEVARLVAEQDAVLADLRPASR